MRSNSWSQSMGHACTLIQAKMRTNSIANIAPKHERQLQLWRLAVANLTWTNPLVCTLMWRCMIERHRVATANSVLNSRHCLILQPLAYNCMCKAASQRPYSFGQVGVHLFVSRAWGQHAAANCQYAVCWSALLVALPRSSAGSGP